MALDPANPFKVPGVYRRESLVRTLPPLPTGVPGFVGFGHTRDKEGRISPDTGSAARAEVLHHVDQLAERWIPPATGKSYLPAAVEGFFANGGLRCYVVGAGPSSGGAAKLADAIEVLGPLTDLDLVCVPDAMVFNRQAPDQAKDVQRAALAHCVHHGNRFAILDAPEFVAEAGAQLTPLLKTWRDDVTGNQLFASLDAAAKERALQLPPAANAALYFPWLRPLDGAESVPPCGHVAGIFARSDSKAGVFRAPANEEILGIVNLDVEVDNAVQRELNPEGINCLRAFPGRGLRLWGARTLSRDPEWQYVSVRRLFLTVGRWIDQNMAWAAFEPDTPRLWIRVQRELGTYLEGLWRRGALKGATPAEAYYVKCDAENNPPEEREQGRVVTEIGLAPTLPAEFVVVQIVHRVSSAELS